MRRARRSGIVGDISGAVQSVIRVVLGAAAQLLRAARSGVPKSLCSCRSGVKSATWTPDLWVGDPRAGSPICELPLSKIADLWVHPRSGRPIQDRSGVTAQGCRTDRSWISRPDRGWIHRSAILLNGNSQIGDPARGSPTQRRPTDRVSRSPILPLIYSYIET